MLAVWKQMQAAGFAPTARLWGSLLMACSAAGQMEQAAIFWWEMKQLHSQGNGGVLTTDNVCAMMTACNDAGQVRGGVIGVGVCGPRSAVRQRQRKLRSARSLLPSRQRSPQSGSALPAAPTCSPPPPPRAV